MNRFCRCLDIVVFAACFDVHIGAGFSLTFIEPWLLFVDVSAMTFVRVTVCSDRDCFDRRLVLNAAQGAIVAMVASLTGTFGETVFKVDTVTKRALIHRMAHGFWVVDLLIVVLAPLPAVPWTHFPCTLHNTGTCWCAFKLAVRCSVLRVPSWHIQRDRKRQTERQTERQKERQKEWKRDRKSEKETEKKWGQNTEECGVTKEKNNYR